MIISYILYNRENEINNLIFSTSILLIINNLVIKLYYNNKII